MPEKRPFPIFVPESLLKSVSDPGRFFLSSVDRLTRTGQQENQVWWSFDELKKLQVGSIYNHDFRCGQLCVFVPEGDIFVEYDISVFRGGLYSFRGTDPFVHVRPSEEPRMAFMDRFLRFKRMIEVSEKLGATQNSSEFERIFQEHLKEVVEKHELDDLTEEQSQRLDHYLREQTEFLDLLTRDDRTIKLIGFAASFLAITKEENEDTSSSENILIEALGGSK